MYPKAKKSENLFRDDILWRGKCPYVYLTITRKKNEMEIIRLFEDSGEIYFIFSENLSNRKCDKKYIFAMRLLHYQKK
jgi:hypothetical protein